jgi:two-component system response regulator PilR (NtrC family)
LAEFSLSASFVTSMNDSPANSPAKDFACLIVEDDPAFCSMMAQLVGSLGGRVREAGTIARAREEFDQSRPDLALLDNHLPDGRGHELYDHFSRLAPEMPAIMITGIPHLGEAVALTRNGLFEYLTKPVDVDVLSACLKRALLRIESRESDPGAEALLGDSPAMAAVRRHLEQAARHPAATVLLTGESGTGKDLAARVIHRLSSTADAGNRPFVPVNCAAIPHDMFEAELFGAEKGAYTGAGQRRTGLVEAGAGGTLFLDEIGDVPLNLQAKLLRLLESGEYRPLGSTASRHFDGRLIAATNRPLKDDIAAGRFREDLFFRMAVLEITLPPLRERSTDLPGLAEALLQRIARKYSRPAPLLKSNDLCRLQNHRYPGNVRELRNILERSLLKSPEDSRWLTLDANWEERPSGTPSPGGNSAAPLPVERRQLPLVDAQEYRVIGQAMKDARGGIRRAAALLGMSPQSLLRRLEKWPELRQSN